MAALPSTDVDEKRLTFDPNDYLLGILKRLLAANQSASVTLPSGGEIRIIPEGGVYASTLAGDRMPQFCSMAADRYAVKKLAVDAKTNGPNFRNIDELLWNVTLWIAQGRLMQGCRADDVVLLKHWPNLTRLDRTPNSIRIAALLSRYPTSISLAYRLLKIPVSELNEFYSAARSAGIAVAVNRKPDMVEESDLKPHRQRSLLGMLLGRIAGL